MSVPEPADNKKEKHKMKFNRMIMAAALASIMTISASGCATSPSNRESQTAATTTEATTTTTAQTTETTAETTETQPAVPAPVYGPEEPQALYITLNGINVRLGMKFDDIKDSLGSEGKPSDDAGTCTGEGDEVPVTHYYAGTMIDVDKKTGLIVRIAIGSSEATGDPSTVTLGGKLKVGGSDASVEELFGKPKDKDTDEDGTIYSFDYDKTMLNVSAKDNKIIDYTFQVTE